MNHFELFGLPAVFELDKVKLSDTYRHLQSQFHPDKFTSASERDKRLVLQKAAEINDAYHVLKSPIQRAEYLLFLNDVDIRAEQQTMNDPEFLMQQMELRETIFELSASDDPETELFDFTNKVDALYQKQYQDLALKLSQQSWHDAADDVRKLKFIEKLQKEIEQLEDKLLG